MDKCLNKVKVLHIINDMSSGGAENYIMNIYRYIDRNKFHFDFLIRKENEEVFFEAEINQLGGKVFKTAPFPKRFIKNYMQTKKFLNTHYYDVVELHANALIYILPLFFLKKKGCKVIMHCHSTKSQKKIYTLLHLFNRIFIHRLCDVCLACSKEAGEWMFKKQFKVIRNSIDINKFMNPSNPRVYNCKTLCMIGKFLEVKNHEFALNLFNEYQKKYKDSKLILVGTGPLKQKIENQVKILKLQNKVTFLGEIRDVENILYNADCLILPSYYEGIPLTLIEAQAANLPCVISDTIDSVVNVTGLVQFAKLNDVKDWIEKLEKLSRKENIEIYSSLKNSGYDIKTNIKMIEEIYSVGEYSE